MLTSLLSTRNATASRRQNHPLGGKTSIRQPMTSTRLAKFLKKRVTASCVVAKLMRFINDNEIEFLGIAWFDLVKAAVVQDAS